jgi:hypothetical protein
MSLTNCRFYEDKYPEVDSYVMVNVKQVRITRSQFVCEAMTNFLRTS